MPLHKETKSNVQGSILNKVVCILQRKGINRTFLSPVMETNVGERKLCMLTSLKWPCVVEGFGECNFVQVIRDGDRVCLLFV